jgi:DNA repair protein RadC
MNTAARSEDSPKYVNRPAPQTDDEIVLKALQILNRRVCTQNLLTSPDDVKNYLILRAATLEDPSREVFSVMYLNSQHGLITVQDEFVGTLSQTSVYPREIVRAALRHGAAAVVLTHNHPSGNVEPSRADEDLTKTLKSALALIDVRVLDHVVVAGGRAVSLAERGLV